MSKRPRVSGDEARQRTAGCSGIQNPEQKTTLISQGIDNNLAKRARKLRALSEDAH
jgi:hypothetical protein